ncbi:hypothetical protein ACGFZS_47140 [Streptomyces sp. NPDC048288]|uniref:hypothetical protein n=1 Tax=Streptomyces sp. NPDC048288 TaxID=3365529 RepID=UPI0037139530
MATPPDPAGAGHGRDRTPLELFATDIETSFNAMSPPRTLTDDDTVAIYLRTLDVWQRVLEGTRARGVITGPQLADLLQTLEGMRQAPRLV